MRMQSQITLTGIIIKLKGLGSSVFMIATEDKGCGNENSAVFFPFCAKIGISFSL